MIVKSLRIFVFVWFKKKNLLLLFLLYNIVLVLPYINMHPPWVYACSPFWTPPPTSFPIPSLWVIPVHHPQASCILHPTWTGDSFLIWYYKNSCAAKETINKIKRQHSEWEKIVTNEATNKELISKIYKELM